jgi:hypothetical protein
VIGQEALELEAADELVLPGALVRGDLFTIDEPDDDRVFELIARHRGAPAGELLFTVRRLDRPAVAMGSIPDTQRVRRILSYRGRP